jgi:hypothetical protein
MLLQDMSAVFDELYMVLNRLLVLLVLHLVIMILPYYSSLSTWPYLLLLYVDDMLITCDDAEHISILKKQLGEQFHMSDLGPLSYFLGIEVQHSPQGYFLS